MSCLIAKNIISLEYYFTFLFLLCTYKRFFFFHINIYDDLKARDSDVILLENSICVLPS